MGKIWVDRNMIHKWYQPVAPHPPKMLHFFHGSKLHLTACIGEGLQSPKARLDALLTHLQYLSIYSSGGSDLISLAYQCIAWCRVTIAHLWPAEWSAQTMRLDISSVSPGVPHQWQWGAVCWPAAARLVRRRSQSLTESQSHASAISMAAIGVG